MLMYQKTMFDPDLLLHKVILSLENFEKKAGKSMKDSYVLKTPVPEQRLISS